MIDPKWIAVADQMQAAARDCARTAHAYHSELLKLGVDRDDALELTICFQQCILARHSAIADEEDS